MTRTLRLVSMSLALAGAAGCAKKGAPAASGPETARSGGPSDSPEVRAGLPSPEVHELMARVHFRFDSSTLDREAREALDAVAATLRNDPTLTVRIEGHADERGSTQYNLALSERRAGAVATYLADLGIPPARMTTAAFGEERPLANGHTEAEWAQNRRAEVLGVGAADRLAGRVRIR